MKSKIRLFLMLSFSIAMVSVFISCSTSPISKKLMTPEVNAENYCVITFHYVAENIKINGIKQAQARDYSPFKVFYEMNDYISYILPPGEYKIEYRYKTNIQYDATGDYRGTTITYKNISFENNFKNGQYYFIVNDQLFNETNLPVYNDPKANSAAGYRKKEIEKVLFKK